MTQTIFAHTPPKESPPSYLNISEANGIITLTVRSKPDDGGHQNIAAIELSADTLAQLAVNSLGFISPEKPVLLLPTFVHGPNRVAMGHALQAAWALVERNENIEAQIGKLGDFIVQNVAGEPSQNEGAVDTAIRVIRKFSADIALRENVGTELRDMARAAIPEIERTTVEDGAALIEDQPGNGNPGPVLVDRIADAPAADLEAITEPNNAEQPPIDPEDASRLGAAADGPQEHDDDPTI